MYIMEYAERAPLSWHLSTTPSTKTPELEHIHGETTVLNELLIYDYKIMNGFKDFLSGKDHPDYGL